MMFDSTNPDTRSIERRALLAGSAVSALTIIHHAYGAFRYGTPWRMHAAAVAALAVAMLLVALGVSRARADSRTGRVAWWAFWSIDAVIFVLFVGIFEGAYNHVLKNVLFFAGTPFALMRQLFPPPMYEMPNDWFFEVTGVLQVVPAALTAYYLAPLLRLRPRRASEKRRAGAAGGSVGGAGRATGVGGVGGVGDVAGDVAGHPAKSGTKMPRLAAIALWTIRVTGPLLVTLGILFWTGRALTLLPLHMAIGLLFTLALLLLGAVAARAGVRRAQVALTIALALIIPIVGVTQTRLLPGSWHWLVKILHLLIGIVGMVAATRVGRAIRDGDQPRLSPSPPVAEPPLAVFGEASRSGRSIPSS